MLYLQLTPVLLPRYGGFNPLWLVTLTNGVTLLLSSCLSSWLRSQKGQLSLMGHQHDWPWGSRTCGWHHWQHQDTRKCSLASLIFVRASFSADWRCSATSNLFRHQKNVSWKRHSKVSHDVTFYMYQWKFKREDLKHLPCIFLKVACRIYIASGKPENKFRRQRSNFGATPWCCLLLALWAVDASLFLKWIGCELTTTEKWTFGSQQIRGLVQMMFHFNWAPC